MDATIIIPNYNYGKYIKQTLKSILIQKYKGRVQVIVIDDGSTDNSLEIIQEAISKIKNSSLEFDLINLEKNRGKLHALNVAIPFARNDISIILDADDYLCPGFLTMTRNTLISYSRKNKCIGFVYTDCNLINAQGKYVGQGVSRTFDPTLLLTESYIPDCGPTFTSILKSALPFDVNIKSSTKHHKWQRIVSLGWVGQYLPFPLFNYRMHDKNLSGIGTRVLSEDKNKIFKSNLLSRYWAPNND